MSELANVQMLSEVVKYAYKSYLFYGPPGTGKSSLAVLHPGKGIVIDMDNKLHEMDYFTSDIRQRINVWSCNELLGNAEGISFDIIDRTRINVAKGWSGGPQPQGYERMRRLLNELIALSRKGEFPYDFAVVDSLTRVSDHLIALVMWSHQVGLMNETLWGVVSANLQKFINGFLSLNCDRIVIAHDKHVTQRNKAGEIVDEYTRPLIVGQMANHLLGYFSEGYYFHGRRPTDSKYIVQTYAESNKPARTSKGLQPLEVADPEIIYKGSFLKP